ncbi:hypothetical protein GH714_019724 [Hevea brasiliensis]|uniref:Uncharacterized protein n=1 Tax=Hevea brasiliensis TaxID=3981 RepID=A0A6A6L764_HEVBR|nr:hypothetical protein GH714_019724 [Hevea brasiliensis]
MPDFLGDQGSHFLRWTSLTHFPESRPFEPNEPLVLQSKLQVQDANFLVTLINFPCQLRQPLVNLKRISLPQSKYLTTIPDLSEAINIESIDLQGCKSLVELPSSIQYLSKLEHLNLRLCKALKNLPCRIDSKFLREFHLTKCYNVNTCPEIFGNLKNLDLSWTAVAQNLSVSQKSWSLEVLATLRVSQTAIKYLPSPIENVKFLETLHLNECKNLVSLPSNIHQLSRLEEIDLTYCKGLLSLPKLPSSLILLKANNCESLENLSSRSKCNFECIHFANCFKLDLKADAHLAIQLIASKLPSHRHQLKGIAFCIVIALEGSQSLPDIIFPIACWINCECRVKADNFEGNAVIGSWQCFDIDVHLLESDHVLLWYDPHSETSQTGLMDEKGWFNKYSDHEVSFDFCFQGLPELIHMLHCNIKKCGVRLLYVEANSKPSSMFDSDTEEEESNSKRIKYSND